MRRIPIAEPWITDLEISYVTRAIKSGWVSSAGPFVEQFENAFARYVGSPYALAVNSGTAALHLSLLALGIGPGDEVIIPALTFIATANAVHYVGAKPIIVDVDPVTWTLDPVKVRDAITERTRAVIPVHLFGHPARMHTLAAVLGERDLRIAVIEDAAEAHGATHDDRHVGSIGAAGCFSFYGNKIITAGEGGMLTTDSWVVDTSARLYRSHGQGTLGTYKHSVIGYNYRMTNLQAALGLAQLRRIDEILERRREIARLYTDALKYIPGIVLPPNASWAEPANWLYSIVLTHVYGKTRDELAKFLDAAGVETRPFFQPIHLQPMYADPDVDAPVAERLAAGGISLPTSPTLADSDIEYICAMIAKFRQR